jgi:hypothetical protein
MCARGSAPAPAARVRRRFRPQCGAARVRPLGSEVFVALPSKRSAMFPCQEDTSRTTTMLAKKMMKASIQCSPAGPRRPTRCPRSRPRSKRELRDVAALERARPVPRREIVTAVIEGRAPTTRSPTFDARSILLGWPVMPLAKWASERPVTDLLGKLTALHRLKLARVPVDDRGRCSRASRSRIVPVTRFPSELRSLARR